MFAVRHPRYGILSGAVLALSAVLMKANYKDKWTTFIPDPNSWHRSFGMIGHHNFTLDPWRKPRSIDKFYDD